MQNLKNKLEKPYHDYVFNGYYYNFETVSLFSIVFILHLNRKRPKKNYQSLEKKSELNTVRSLEQKIHIRHNSEDNYLFLFQII